jgi:hypothetical protein
MTSDNMQPDNMRAAEMQAAETQAAETGSTYFRRRFPVDMYINVPPTEPEATVDEEREIPADAPVPDEQQDEVTAPRAVGVTAFPGVSAAVLAAATASDHPQSQPSGARLALVTSSTPERRAVVQSELDRLSLDQALLDVEVANARVIDLTSRLVEANQRAATVRAEADALRAQVAAAAAQADAQTNSAHAELAVRAAEIDARAAHLEAQKASMAYRWAAKVWNLRNALKN